MECSVMLFLGEGGVSIFDLKMIYQILSLIRT